MLLAVHAVNIYMHHNSIVLFSTNLNPLHKATYIEIQFWSITHGWNDSKPSCL
jgi:hypothetical protein